MGRRLSLTKAITTAPLVLPISLGGTGASTVDSAHAILDTASKRKIGTAGNAVPLNSVNMIDPKFIPSGYGHLKPKIANIRSNNPILYYGERYEMKMVNVDISQDLTISALHGTITWGGGNIEVFDYVAPTDERIPEETFYICGYPYTVSLGINSTPPEA